MKIGILAAMNKEVELILPLMRNRRDGNLKNLKVSYGDIGEHEVCVATCGIGKVNSAMSAMRLIDGFSPDIVINSGVAGGADKSMHVLDLLIATKVSYHDVWCGPETSLGAANGLDVYLPADERFIEAAKETLYGGNIRYGLICSGDRFITTEEEVAGIKSNFPDCLAVDMESASIAQVCVMNGIPFAVVRAISDTPGSGENISQYENFWSDAPAETFNALRSVLSILK